MATVKLCPECGRRSNRLTLAWHRFVFHGVTTGAAASKDAVERLDRLMR